MYHRTDSGRGVAAGGAAVHRFSSDEMGNSHLQFEACRLLVAMLIDYLKRAVPDRLFRVGGELLFITDPGAEPGKVVPDLYVMEDEPQAGPKLPSWKKWEHGGKAPSLAIEVVSDSYEKDYTPEEMPARYAALGVRELVRYDPDHASQRRGKYERRLLSHFVRNAAGVLEERPGGDAVRLVSYPLWLVHRPPYYLRLATGDAPDSLTLWPTPEERVRSAEERAAAEAERAAAEAERVLGAEERAAAEAERAAAEAERAAAEAERARGAEAEVERLRAEIARLRGS